MKKTLVEFLADRELVAKDRLVSAMIEQKRPQPAISEVIYDNQLMPRIDLYRVLVLQRQRGEDFVSAAKSLGLWNEEIAEQVEIRISGVSKPIVQYLVEAGDLNLNDLNGLLDSYIEMISSTGDEEAAVDSVVIQEEKVSEVSIDVAFQSPIHSKMDRTLSIFKLDSVSPPVSLDSILIQEYLQIFKSHITQNLQPSLLDLESETVSEAKIRNFVDRAAGELRAVEAAGRFLGASISVQICREVLTQLNRFVNRPTIPNFNSMKDLVAMGCEVLDVFSQLLAECGAESIDSKDANLHDLLVRLESAISTVKSELGSSAIAA